MLEDIRLAFQGIWSHKLRSALTMLGIIIGIGSITKTVRAKYKPAITGTITSKTFAVACFLNTITAARNTKIAVEIIGLTEKAFSNAEDTELPIT